ncbi:DgyrCDS5771 [Dimorphilus gyrociliatus]|uniref:DgyrCDS5771 n=1 Tax=Dimorphilus gyrociliatus TaxID=2664684 RepID=A0A7I8VL13_9ANNE|nr:DgyrCDS5771 [Dimorphilus gyrociliatus]
MKSTTVTLSDMVNLAIGTPETGVVNLNILRKLLHEMLQKLSITDSKADVDEEKESKNQLNVKMMPGTILEDDVSEISEEKVHIRPTSVADSGIAESIDSKDAKSDSKKFDSRVSKSAPSSLYHQLSQKVGEMEKQINLLTSLPSNNDLFERVGSEPKPVSDMWNLMQVQKKAEANEEGVNRLMSLVQDLMIESKKNQKDCKDLHDKLSSLSDQIKELSNKIDSKPDNVEKYDDSHLKSSIQNLIDQLESMKKGMDNFLTKEEKVDLNPYVKWSTLEDMLHGLRKEMNELNELNQKSAVVIEAGIQTEPEQQEQRVPSRMSTPEVKRPDSGPTRELRDMLQRLGRLADQHDQLQARVDFLAAELASKADKSALDMLGDLSKSGIDSGALHDLRKELDNLKASRNRDSEQIRKLQGLLNNIQNDLDRIHNRLKELGEDAEEKQKHIDTLYSISNKLEENKADKEWLENELSKKADKKILGNKVDRSTFDDTCDDLSRMISDMLQKLSCHDDEWKKAIERLNSDMDGKFDRLEFGPIKADLERQLRNMQKQLKNLTLPPDQDDEAAGLRKQLLQRFNCLSCDKPLDVGPLGPAPIIPSQGLPATRTNRPHTIFELEQVRQQAKSNMGFSTEIMDLQASARPCGGQHTLTYPHRRITKTNAFGVPNLADEIPTRDELDIQGADGHIYKGVVDSTKLPNLVTPNAPRQSKTSHNNKRPGNSSGDVHARQRPMSASALSKEQYIAPQPPPPSEPETTGQTVGAE